MDQIKGLRCPSCGAPLPPDQGERETACGYCGQRLLVREKPEENGVPQKPEILIIRPKRNALDIILICLGTIWCIIVLAVFIDMKYWKNMTEIVAALLLAAPGIVLLLIGFRRKKVKIIRGELPGAKK